MAPEEILKWWEKFGMNEQNPIHAQVSTVNGTEPQVRTVNVRYLQTHQCLAICTHKSTQKWLSLTKNPRLAGCYYDIGGSRQLRWGGGMKLVEHDQELLDKMWPLIPEEVKRSYWAKEEASQKDLSTCCPSLGVILSFPVYWDIYHLDPSDFEKSERTIYQYLEKTWRGTLVT